MVVEPNFVPFSVHVIRPHQPVWISSDAAVPVIEHPVCRAVLRIHGVCLYKDKIIQSVKCAGV